MLIRSEAYRDRDGWIRYWSLGPVSLQVADWSSITVIIGRLMLRATVLRPPRSRSDAGKVAA